MSLSIDDIFKSKEIIDRSIPLLLNEEKQLDFIVKNLNEVFDTIDRVMRDSKETNFSSWTLDIDHDKNKIEGLVRIINNSDYDYGMAIGCNFTTRLVIHPESNILTFSLDDRLLMKALPLLPRVTKRKKTYTYGIFTITFKHSRFHNWIKNKLKGNYRIPRIIS